MSNTKRQQELIARLQDVCDELGVILGIPAGDEVGVLIGTQAFIESVAVISGEHHEYTEEEDYNDALEEALADARDLPKGKNNDDPKLH